MLEKMDEFFRRRVEGYDEHQLTSIDNTQEFMDFTAKLLPMGSSCKVLDLGCGTGLELESYFRQNPSAEITGIDMAPAILEKLREKFPEKNIRLILGSYFDIPFEENFYDAAISVESLHHFTYEEKLPLYRKLYASLKDGAGFRSLEVLH